jgi:hypothetical protein
MKCCAFGLLVAASACGSRPETRADGARHDSAAAASVVRDSLVLSAPGGAGVWLTAGRDGRRPDGTTCAERLIEIRRETMRVRVPLLYTGEAPRLVDDSTLEARLWLHCERGDLYRVHLTTGQPVKVTRSEK